MKMIMMLKIVITKTTTKRNLFSVWDLYIPNVTNIQNYINHGTKSRKIEFKYTDE